MTTSDPCPCGSGRDFSACCGTYHAGAEPPTAEALMRSRFSAFARRDAAYLARTAHPLLRARLDPRGLARSFALAWTRLEIVATSAGGSADREGTVHFRAHWQGGGASGVLEEVSRFVRDRGGAWLYRDGRNP